MMLRIELCLLMACLFSSVGLVGCKFRSAGAMSTPKAIFGKDDRKEWFELGNPLQSLASATVAMIDRSNLIETPDGYAISPKVKDYRTWAGLCPKVRFAEQPTAADCTGFLVGPDLMVTAGHCVSDQYPCNSYAIVLSDSAPPLLPNRWIPIGPSFDWIVRRPIDRIFMFVRAVIPRWAQN